MSPTASSRRVWRAPALLCVVALAASSAVAQTWDYKAYTKDPRNGQYDPTRFVTATVSIEEKDGKWTFRMVTPGRGDPCISRGGLPAEVEKTEQTTVITVTPLLADCPVFRYVIQNDGSGGIKLNKRDDKWVPDKFDHGLTPTK